MLDDFWDLRYYNKPKTMRQFSLSSIFCNQADDLKLNCMAYKFVVPNHNDYYANFSAKDFLRSISTQKLFGVSAACVTNYMLNPSNTTTYSYHKDACFGEESHTKVTHRN